MIWCDARCITVWTCVTLFLCDCIDISCCMVVWLCGCVNGWIYSCVVV